MVVQAEHFASTYVVFVTFHVVCKGGAAQLIGPEEAEVPRDFSGDGGGQALEEALRSLVPHNGFYHRPHCASDRAEGRMVPSLHTQYSNICIN